MDHSSNDPRSRAMTPVSERPPGANVTDPSAPKVDLSDPTVRAAWLADLHEQMTDGLAAALDATAPPAARDLGRREARRIITDAERSGSPGARAEIEPPLVLLLRALRATVTGWARVSRQSTMFASVPLADLDLLARRIDAAIEIARRGAIDPQPSERAGGAS
jgi:hypothetical protein